MKSIKKWMAIVALFVFSFNMVLAANIANEVQAAPSVCGNGILEAGEACDDRDLDNGDGCNSQCRIEDTFRCRTNAGCASKNCVNHICKEKVVTIACGNGILEAGEACDDGDLDNGDGCNSQCRIEDGFRCRNNSGCASQNCVNHICKKPYVAQCGNGILDSGEACDDGNRNNNDKCNNQCRITIGNGTCSSNANCETGAICNNGTCKAANVCGNGILDSGEACDDANSINGDGCNTLCKIESTEDNKTNNKYTCNENSDCASNLCIDEVCRHHAAPDACVDNDSKPEARDDNVTVNSIEASVLDVQKNDISRESNITKGSTRIINEEGKEVTTLTTAGQGTWSVNTVSGMIHFQPIDVSTGTANIHYTIKDDCNKTSNIANLHVSFSEDCLSTQQIDRGTALGNISMMILLLLTGSLGLFYVRREEFAHKKN